MHPIRFVRAWTLLAAAVGLSPAAAGTDIPLDVPVPETRFTSRAVLPAEFERQQAVLIGWNSDDDFVQAAQRSIVAAIYKRVRVVILVPTDKDQKGVADAMRAARVPLNAVHLVRLPIDTIWARDYGPVIVRAGGGTWQVVDSHYGHADRPDDDDVPAALAPKFGLETKLISLIVDGGNVLSNGAGLCLTTEAVLDHNAPLGLTEDDVKKAFREHFGARQTLILEPLAGEPTGHVDMFATFTSARTVLVGEISPELDPINAAILDRNAARLAAVRTPAGPLHVIRIPMPPPTDGTWRSYTNVLYANGVLLMPTYRGIDLEGENRARALYRTLLPGWKVVDIDCGQLIELGGAVHCLTMNLCRIEHLPGAPGAREKPRSPRRAHPLIEPEDVAGRDRGNPFGLRRERGARGEPAHSRGGSPGQRGGE